MYKENDSVTRDISEAFSHSTKKTASLKIKRWKYFSLFLSLFFKIKSSQSLRSQACIFLVVYGTCYEWSITLVYVEIEMFNWAERRESI